VTYFEVIVFEILLMARIFRDFAKLFSVANGPSVCNVFAIDTCFKKCRAITVARIYAYSYLHARVWQACVGVVGCYIWVYPIYPQPKICLFPHRLLNCIGPTSWHYLHTQDGWVFYHMNTLFEDWCSSKLYVYTKLQFISCIIKASRLVLFLEMMIMVIFVQNR
jgi:hypothetical protein